jgi:hypothetical protein
LVLPLRQTEHAEWTASRFLAFLGPDSPLPLSPGSSSGAKAPLDRGDSWGSSRWPDGPLAMVFGYPNASQGGVGKGASEGRDEDPRVFPPVNRPILSAIRRASGFAGGPWATRVGGTGRRRVGSMGALIPKALKAGRILGGGGFASWPDQKNET